MGVIVDLVDDGEDSKQRNQTQNKNVFMKRKNDHFKQRNLICIISNNINRKINSKNEVNTK